MGITENLLQALCSYLYHAIENTANQNALKPLYWFISIPQNIPNMQRNDLSVGFVFSTTWYKIQVMYMKLIIWTAEMKSSEGWSSQLWTQLNAIA